MFPQRSGTFVVLAICGCGPSVPAPDPIPDPDPQHAPAPLAEPSEPANPFAEAWLFDLPEPDLSTCEERTLWATFYYVPNVTEDPDGFPLRTMTGDALGARLSRRDWCEAAMQGTVIIDGHVYNYDGITDALEVDCTPVYPKHPAIGRTRYRIAVGPFGDGVEEMALVPYRSIAVNPAVIPIGSVVYIPEARGTALRLPDGRDASHDGYFFAADRGGAIEDTHIDVFVGVGRQNPFAFVRNTKKAPFVAHIAQRHPIARARLRAAHLAFVRR